MNKYKRGHRYSEEFKSDAVRMVITEKQSPRVVADTIEVKISVLNDWLVEPLISELQKAEDKIIDLEYELNKTADERMRELQEENKILREQIDTLKRTVGIFSAKK